MTQINLQIAKNDAEVKRLEGIKSMREYLSVPANKANYDNGIANLKSGLASMQADPNVAGSTNRNYAGIMRELGMVTGNSGGR